MSDTLKIRLRFRGGDNKGRMIRDKVVSLRRALFNSYQSGTAVLKDGREFLGLFNPVNTKADYDTKMLSIPYKDVCLNKENDQHLRTEEGMEPTDIKNGDVIVWKETNTHWLVYLEHVEEIAYFRADIRRCDQTIEINGNTYWVYLRGPVETALVTGQKQGLAWNQLNYSEVMYITRNKETDDYFHRFSTIKIGNIENDWEGGDHHKTWKVVSVNPYYGDGIIEVFLDEDYENQFEEARQEEIKIQIIQEEESKPSPNEVQIDGPDSLEIYSTGCYSLVNIKEPKGTWSVNNTKIEIASSSDPGHVKLRVNSGKSGQFILTYTDGDFKIEKLIKIQSF